uniref:Uncharacterized protein n=1 Tax=Caenorhabditis japonica TaxID=281687 RepID=A0A8R1HQT1_CAEJA
MVSVSPYRVAIIDCARNGMTNPENVQIIGVHKSLIHRTVNQITSWNRRCFHNPNHACPSSESHLTVVYTSTQFSTAAKRPSSSSNLNPMDYAIGGYLTLKIYTRNYSCFVELKVAFLKNAPSSTPTRSVFEL